jgi:shikimate kinase
MMSNNNIILVGRPEVGKSTLGRLIAEKLNMEYLDIDAMAVSRLGFRRPSDFLFRSGELPDALRSVIHELPDNLSNAIIDVGGEAFTDRGNIEALRLLGTIIHIKRNPELVEAGRQGSGLALKNVNTGEIIDIAKHAIEEYNSITTYEEFRAIEIVYNGALEDSVTAITEVIINRTGDSSDSLKR